MPQNDSPGRRDLVVTVGNSASPHLRIWVAEAERLGWERIHVDSHPPGGPRQLVREVRAARRLLRERRRSGARVSVQGHGAGRSGLLAALLVDPHPTTIVHGSEVIAAGDASWPARTAVRWVLRRSSEVIVTAASTAPFVTALAPGTTDKIRLVHPGVEWSELEVAHVDPGTAEVSVLSVRRMLPLYEIVDLVEAHQRDSARAELILLRGAVDPAESYAAAVDAQVSADPRRIRVISDFLDPKGLAQLYAEADIAVSLAGTDQLSSSVLEALGAGCVLVLTDLDAYRSVSALPQVVRVRPRPTVDEIDAALDAAVQVLERLGRGAEERRSRARAAREAFEQGQSGGTSILT